MENECKICITQEIFVAMIKAGFDVEEAFHLTVGKLLEGVLGEAIEEGYDAGYDDGYKEATNDINEIIGAYTDSVNEA